MLTRETPGLLVGNGAAQIIATNMTSDDRLLTFDTTLAVEAQRNVMPGLEMAQFSYWPTMDSQSAASNRVINHEQLMRAISAGEPKVVALTDHDFYYFITPALKEPPAEVPFVAVPMRVFPQLGNHYRMERIIYGYGQFKDTLYILVCSTCP